MHPLHCYIRASRSNRLFLRLIELLFSALSSSLLPTCSLPSLKPVSNPSEGGLRWSSLASLPLAQRTPFVQRPSVTQPRFPGRPVVRLYILFRHSNLTHHGFTSFQWSMHRYQPGRRRSHPLCDLPPGAPISSCVTRHDLGSQHLRRQQQRRAGVPEQVRTVISVTQARD